tara:strand:- start:593 stop:718 length:126 start_codon:yes stop_codon:yes gene_type:complete
MRHLFKVGCYAIQQVTNARGNEGKNKEMNQIGDGKDKRPFS